MSRRRVRAVARRETLHILRDPRSLAMAVLLPIVMLLLYGFGINLDVRHIRTAVLDEDHTRASRDLLQSFSESGYFDFMTYLGGYGDVAPVLDNATVRCVLIVPRDFQRDLTRGAGTAALIVDGSDATTATIAIGYAGQIARRFSEEKVSDALRRAGESAVVVSPVELRTRYWYNRELKSNDFVVPGLAAVILAMLAALLTSMTIVRERERGSIEQVVVSPIQPAELILGKLVPYVVLAFLDIVLVIGGGHLIFGVPIRGSLILLAVASLIFLVASLALGLLVSSIARTQLVAMMIAITATMLPVILLSGFVFPISTMPAAARAITYLIPARYYLIIVRGILLKGIGIGILWPQMALLAVVAVALIAMSAHLFRKVL